MYSSNIDEIKSKVESISQDGNIRINSYSEIKDLETLYPYLQLDKNYTIVETKRTQSRVNSDLYYVKYQEYYKGVKVTGGVVFRPDGPLTPFDPCDGEPVKPAFIRTTIFSGIDIDISPSIDQTDLKDIVHAQVENVELVISHGLVSECNYNLVWVVDYHSDRRHRAWIDAHSGNLLKSVIFDHNGISSLERSSSITSYELNLIKTSNSLNTSISGDDDIVISRLNECGGPVFGTNGLSDYLSGGTDICPITEEDTPLEFAIREKIQKVREDLEEIVGAQFNSSETNTSIHFMIGCEGRQAFNIGFGDFTTTTYIYMELDHFENNGLPTTDVLAHELAHSYTNQFFQSDLSNESGSLHEGISDIFGMYLESICSNGPMDPVLADEVGLDIRDASNAPADCWDDVATGHTQGVFLANWFWELSKEFDEKLLMEILIDAIQSIDNDNATIEGFYQGVLNVVEQTEADGLCSDIGKAIVDQFDQMCIGNVNDICPEFRYAGPLSFCEEDDFICIRVEPLGEPYLDDFRWRFPNGWDIVLGDGSPYNGNQSTYESAFVCVDFPDYSYYPKKIEFCVERVATENFGSDTRCFTITLTDCDFDDPTCEEHHGLDGLTQNSVLKSRSNGTYSVNADYSSSSVSSISVFSINGTLLYQGERLSLENENNMLRSYSQMLFFAEYDSSGKLLRTRKRLLTN